MLEIQRVSDPNLWNKSLPQLSGTAFLLLFSLFAEE